MRGLVGEMVVNCENCVKRPCSPCNTVLAIPLVAVGISYIVQNASVSSCAERFKGVILRKSFSIWVLSSGIRKNAMALA